MLTCPRDREILATNDPAGFRYHTCQRCEGCWIPGGALQRALAAQGVVELRQASVTGRVGVGCPDCRLTCAEVVVSGCALDRCDRCGGVWLDGGELRRVRALFPPTSPVFGEEGLNFGAGLDLADRGFSVVELVAQLFLGLTDL